MPSRYLRPIDYSRMLAGWLVVLLLPDRLPAAVLLIAVVAVIMFCAFGVVTQAEKLAGILGDPLGSLVLTLSIVIIEVILIVAVMLGPGQAPTIARDSVMAVSMIILALVTGLSLLVGGIRHGGMDHNGTGTRTYLSLIAVMATTTFALPHLLGTGGAYGSLQAVLVAVSTLALYTFFLRRQLGAQAGDFREPDTGGDRHEEHAVSGHLEVALRISVLIITVLPIVVLSHRMAAAMDSVLGDLGAPPALAGMVIAVIVFLPETITALRASWDGRTQRMSNLVHGALVSTVGLTIPTVLLIGVLGDRAVVLGETPANLVILGLAVVVSMAVFSGRRVNAVHGAALLMIFGIYMMALLS
ncbi:calcium:proton antiporter [Corynebacterium pacaense]|uniref:calcium:proton antiporter n=1 Tax=Corynebacterium pacaense TaxID=1816684 RepID=UPI0009BC0AC9|nr:calcium:proton antiporter [Corynebacterium pacaense]